MIKKNGRELFIVVVLCILADIASRWMGETNLGIAKIALFCLSTVFSLVAVIFSIRVIMSVFASPTDHAINVDCDKLDLKKKILVYVFVITFLLAIVGFCIFYFVLI